MKYLITATETYRVDTEPEADALIEEAKAEGLNKYSCTYKEAKQKGEVVDSWYRVVLTKNFTEEKNPDRTVTVSYEG